MKTYTDAELEAMSLEELIEAAKTPPTSDRPDVIHARKKTARPRGRRNYSAAHFARLSNRTPDASTLCGAEVTAYDVTASDARKGPVERLCPKCSDLARDLHKR